MELRHFRYFVAVAEELSFTRAADRMHVTQSTLSHQIKQLENEIGQVLFERDRKHVTMTEAGQNLLGNMIRLLREFDDSIRAMKGESDPLAGSLRVGSTHTFNTTLLPSCLAAFLTKHVAVSVTIHELCAADIETELSEGRMDIGIGYLPAANRGLSFEPLYLEEMVLAVSTKHPLAGRKRVRLAELHRQPLVLATPESATRRMLNQRFQAVGAQPFVAAEIDAIGPMLELARQSCIGAIVSEIAIADMTGLQIVALEDPIPLRTPGILWQTNAPRSAACRSFISIVRQTVTHARMRTPKPGRRRQPNARAAANGSMQSIN